MLKAYNRTVFNSYANVLFNSIYCHVTYYCERLLCILSVQASMRPVPSISL